MVMYKTHTSFFCHPGQSCTGFHDRETEMHGMIQDPWELSDTLLWMPDQVRHDNAGDIKQ